VPDTGELERWLSARGEPHLAGASLDRAVAILVSGRALARSTWVDEADVSEADFERLLEEKAPDIDFMTSRVVNFRTLDPSSRSAKLERCRQCRSLPAQLPCPHCDGTGELTTEDGKVACAACFGGTAPPCSACGGTRRSVHVKVVFGEDTPKPFAHIFLPELPFGLRGPLTRFFLARGSVPDILTIDLADEFQAADAYRGRRSRSEVRGHRADAALALARTYVERLSKLPSFTAVRAAAFAWPFVVVSELGPARATRAAIRDEIGALWVLP